MEGFFILIAMIIVVTIIGYMFSKRIDSDFIDSANEYFPEPTSKHKFKPKNSAELRRYLKQAKNCKHIDISEIVSLSGIFAYFSNKSNNFFNGIETWDTSHIKDFSYTFANCKNFDKKLNWNTSRGEDFTHMFLGCSSLSEIPQLDFRNAAFMYGIFDGCNLKIPQKISDLINKLSTALEQPTKEKSLAKQEDLIKEEIKREVESIIKQKFDEIEQQEDLDQENENATKEKMEWIKIFILKKFIEKETEKSFLINLPDESEFCDFSFWISKNCVKTYKNKFIGIVLASDWKIEARVDDSDLKINLKPKQLKEIYESVSLD